MSRRALLLGGMLSAAVAGAFTVAKGYPASAGEGAVRTWQWVALPGSKGLEVFATDAAQLPRASVRVVWTTDGHVSAAFPAPLSVSTPGTVTCAAGYSLAVRRVGS